jgi:protein SCO1/2
VVRRFLTHPLFAPGLVLATLGLGAATMALLLWGPGRAPWVDALLTSCFGWSAETRRYRLDSLVLVLLQPPLFVAVIAFFYADELRHFLGSAGGRVTGGLATAVFATLGASLLFTSEISASGATPTPAALSSPIRQGAPAPSFSLTDQRGEPVSLEGLRGRPVAMTFFYGNCHASCPVLLARLKALEVREGGRRDTAYVAVTLDPARDTPESLTHAAARWEFGPRWHLLTGPPAEVRAVTAAYAVQHAPLPDGEIAHENVILMIDRAGRIAFVYRGLAHPEDRQAADLARLAAERG